jgi:hypothetical protein
VEPKPIPNRTVGRPSISPEKRGEIEKLLSETALTHTAIAERVQVARSTVRAIHQELKDK